MIRWHIVTGEYPPQPGGVADYTRLVARQLALAGDEVHVWAPECGGEMSVDPGVMVRHLPGRFGVGARRILGQALDQAPGPYRLLVQYVPHMYGLRGMNVPFCLWLRRRRADRPWVMFHEVAFPVARGQKWRHNLLGRTQRWMARIVAEAAERVWVSIPAWEPILRTLQPRLGSVTWLPVPSNVSTQARPAQSTAIRARLGALAGDLVVGHFGTFGGPVAEALAKMLPTVLGKPGRVGLLVGRGAGELQTRLLESHPELAGRLHAAADLEADAVADHLRACDALLQPYPDGVSSRRGSVMTGLALGLPIATSEGFLSESIWRDESLVALAPAGDFPAQVAVLERLLESPDERRRLGERAAAGYARNFSVEHTVRKLREAAASGESP
jgi:glycosyltransferase involved in cell wall biosynthesis